MNIQETTIDHLNYSYQFNLTSQDTDHKPEVTITGSAAENFVGISAGNEKEAWTMPENEREQLVERLKSLKVSELPGDLLPERTVEVTKD